MTRVKYIIAQKPYYASVFIFALNHPQPGLFPASRDVEMLTSHVDLVPTILGVAEVKAGEAQRKIKSPAIAQAQLSFHDSHVDYEYDNKIDEREGVDLLQVIWPYLERALVEPQSITELAAIFDLREVQLNDWMDRAMNENKVRKLGNGDKYVLTTHADTT